MLKSSIFKKVISVVLALATVCTFSMVSCFAQGDGSGKWYHAFGELDGRPCYMVMHDNGNGTADFYFIDPNNLPPELQFLRDNNANGENQNDLEGSRDSDLN